MANSCITMADSKFTRRLYSKRGYVDWDTREPDHNNATPGGNKLYRRRSYRPIQIVLSTLGCEEEYSEISIAGSHLRQKRSLFRFVGNLATPSDGRRSSLFRRASIAIASSKFQINKNTTAAQITIDHEFQVDSPATPANLGQMTAAEFLRSSSRPQSNGNGRVGSPVSRPSLDGLSRLAPKGSRGSLKGSRSTTPIAAEEKPLASGNGVSLSVNLAEPMLFLQGFDQHDTTSRSTAMLRGTLHLKVAKAAKIKTVTLKFKGTATTKWPEGIPPKKLDFEETDSLMSHVWPFFNAQFPTAEQGTGADYSKLAKSIGADGIEHGSPYMTASPAISIMNSIGRDPKRLSLQNTYSRSFDKNDAHKSSVASKGYRTFQPGDYYYNFELPLDSRLPETINVDLGSVKYELEAIVERSGAFKANLTGQKEVTLIRAPSEGSLEQVEPIAISRNWEDQLHYDIVISGKSFPLGSKIPIAFKLTPLAKVQCHRIKVFVTENMEYFCSNKRVHRMEPTRKILLFEKRADGTQTSTFSGSSSKVTSGGGVPYDQRDAAARGETVQPTDTSNLLGHLESDTNIGPTEMEFSVQLPGCQSYVCDKEKTNRIHFDTTYQNIQVHHWIKIVMRLSRPDATDPTKRRHFEISIDSPFHILSCRASQANTALPAYSMPNGAQANSNLASCGCPGAPKRRISPTTLPTLQALNGGHSPTDSRQSSDEGLHANGEGLIPQRPALARPPTAHLHNINATLQRPIHMLRAPSFNPPAFNAEEPPPPLLTTPPPQYNDIASPTAGHGLADYFSRLAEVYDEDSSGDEAAQRRGRVNIPLTPGGGVNRSMDLQRTWIPVGL